MRPIKFIAITFALFFVVGCSSEKIKIKRALKESVGIEQAKDYKFKSYQIVATQLRTNITDSIASLNTNNELLKVRMLRTQEQIESCRRNINDCKKTQRSTMYWLRSSYDYIIGEWEEMLDKATQSKQVDSVQLDLNNKKLNFFKQNLEATDSPIVFYIIKHDYTINGAVRQEKVTLDANYKLTQYNL